MSGTTHDLDSRSIERSKHSSKAGNVQADSRLLEGTAASAAARLYSLFKQTSSITVVVGTTSGDHHMQAYCGQHTHVYLLDLCHTVWVNSILVMAKDKRTASLWIPLAV